MRSGEVANIDSLWSALQVERAAERQWDRNGWRVPPGRRLRARNLIVERYRSLVEHVARQLAAKLPQSVDRGDLESYGTISLIDAIDKFDPDRGWTFETYAMSRIRGGIIDEMRRADELPRSVRLQARQVRTAFQKLERRYNRRPSHAEVATLMGVTEVQLQDLLVAETASIDGFSRTGVDADGSGDPLGTAEPTVEHAAHDEADIISLRATVAEAIERLPRRERAILALYYRERLTTADIAKALNIATGRVSQVQTGALRELRRNLAGPIIDGLLAETATLT